MSRAVMTSALEALLAGRAGWPGASSLVGYEERAACRGGAEVRW